MERTDTSSTFSFGTLFPAFTLKNVDSSSISSLEYAQGANAVLVLFTCNHCPYVKGSEEAVINTVKSFLNDGLKVLAINSNDPVKYPEDNFPHMQQKAKELNIPYPYLLDETQEVAKLFDAACTPEAYLFDKTLRLVYHGTVNDSPRDPSKVTKNYLETAIIQVLKGQNPEPSFTHPLGCSIKWK